MRFVTLDVFTDTPFGGNRLAVVLAADGLTTPQMQSVAAEFGFSETAFVCSTTVPGLDARVRIFTPTKELGFAGHPNVGAALALAEGDRTLRFEEGAGPVVVNVRAGVAEVEAPQGFERLGTVDAAMVAAACGISERDVIGDPVLATCGTAFIVARTSALGAARPVSSLESVTGVLLYTPGDPIRARVFAPGIGVPEDPATGSAALVLAGLLGEGAWTIEQGIEMGRPSLLRVRSDGRGRTWVAGTAVEMMRGSLTAWQGLR